MHTFAPEVIDEAIESLFSGDVDETLRDVAENMLGRVMGRSLSASDFALDEIAAMALADEFDNLPKDIRMALDRSFVEEVGNRLEEKLREQARSLLRETISEVIA